MIAIITLLLSIVFDGVISLFLTNKSYLQPLLTITCLFMIFPIYKKNQTKYIVISVIAGLIYDLLYTNLLFFHAILFYLLTKLIIYIHNNYKQNLLTTIIFLSIIITTYECLTQFILFFFRIVPFSIEKLAFKIIHSLILNILFAILLYSLNKGIKFKRKA